MVKCSQNDGWAVNAQVDTVDETRVLLLRIKERKKKNVKWRSTTRVFGGNTPEELADAAGRIMSGKIYGHSEREHGDGRSHSTEGNKCGRIEADKL